jgi:hypothetical protein
MVFRRVRWANHVTYLCSRLWVIVKCLPGTVCPACRLCVDIGFYAGQHFMSVYTRTCACEHAFLYRIQLYFAVCRLFTVCF